MPSQRCATVQTQFSVHKTTLNHVSTEAEKLRRSGLELCRKMTATQATYVNTGDASPTEALAPGTVLLNGQYTIERYLASGGFGITYLARDSLERMVVIKECFPEAICSRTNKTVTARSRSHLNEFQSLVDMFVREARSIAKLNHPNIVGVHQVFEDNETAYMALDHIEGRDLLDTIESGAIEMSPDEIKSMLLNILDAVSTVHGQDMLHRDISPDNILIDRRGVPVLIDFGAAREEASKKSRALSAVMVVKEGYSPQEFYIAGSQQTPCSDLYALAATFFHLITGQAPPNSQSRLAAIASHALDPYSPLKGRIEGYEAEFLEAIDVAMNVFPGDRIQSAIEWITRIDVERRRQAALAAANDDQQIELTVMELVTLAKSVPDEPAEVLAAPSVMPKPVVKKPARLATLLEEPVREVTARLEAWQLAPIEDDRGPVFYEEDLNEKIAEPAQIADTLPAPAQEPPVYEEPEAATPSSVPRQMAAMVIVCCVLVAMFDGRPAQIGHAAAPLFEHVFGLMPLGASGSDPPTQS